ERVVCGAPNVPPPGHLVARAPVGARLGAIGLTLEPRDIGGVSSSGMLVSEAELGLAEESEGILVWEPGAAAEGTPLRQLLPAAYDTIFEIGITPNRPDALGHLGLARDLAAVYGLPAPAIESPALALAPGPTAHVTVELADPERCPLYTGALVQGVTVGPSPAWLRRRLHLLGIRPISNVVDVTNLVLLERGQPMHGFDAARIGGGRVVIRRATPGEALRTLDGVARRLDPDDLVIADGAAPTALAGVMGGGDSEIRPETRDVFLECAYFQPRGVRRTSRRHGLSTESSYRFERGVDPGGVEPALARAASLLAELAGGRVFAPGTVARGELPAPPRMNLRSRTLDATLGVPVPFEEARAVLERLGFRTSGAPGALELDVEGASFRPDVTREIDLVEEVARIRGLDGIPARIPALAPESADDPLALERAALREAAALGLSEAVTYSFSSPEELAKVHAPPPAVSLRNPMSEDRRALRTSLLPGLLDATRRARRRGEPSVRL
ncbi:MAG: phenylalanine--tRNA ligase subunit beta, partial [Deltaproteobacteria bacterium]|nr:phenylalanine--tRNA ligase subunit beta [Deltaproteobacteria bacterium]